MSLETRLTGSLIDMIRQDTSSAVLELLGSTEKRRS